MAGLILLHKYNTAHVVSGVALGEAGIRLGNNTLIYGVFFGNLYATYIAHIQLIFEWQWF